MSTELEAFQSRYHDLEELKNYARSVGLQTDGGKRNLHTRISRYLVSKNPDVANKKPVVVPDSLVIPITESTPLISLKLDANTRQFFRSRIGNDFKFNQYLRDIASLEDPRSLRLTYGDLIKGWSAFEAKRKTEKVIRPQYQYQQFVRDFYANPKNKGKPMADCSTAWNNLKASGVITNRLSL